MSFSIVLPIWQAVQERFHKTVKALPEQNLSLQMGASTIGGLIKHNAEVEYMFAEWFFGRNKKEVPETSGNNLEELVALLTSSNENLIEAMRELPEEAWQQPVESSIGTSTPLEALGRLMYHTGIHSGQISLIQKTLVTK